MILKIKATAALRGEITMHNSEFKKGRFYKASFFPLMSIDLFAASLFLDTLS